jgi:hypothetical protein
MTVDPNHFSDDEIQVVLDATDGLWSSDAEAHDAVFKTLNELYSRGYCLVKKEYFCGCN